VSRANRFLRLVQLRIIRIVGRLAIQFVSLAITQQLACSANKANSRAEKFAQMQKKRRANV
jgi:hypothetical protein